MKKLKHKNKKTAKIFEIIFALNLVLVILKLCDALDVSWFIIFAPLELFAVMFFVFIGICYFIFKD